jgi:hypothetical protein
MQILHFPEFALIFQKILADISRALLWDANVYLERAFDL